MRVLRLSHEAATAIIAAACGDKVTVAGPSSSALKIESVLVAPASATISVGQTVTLTAAVNVDNGVTATVVWSSSSSAATLSSSSNTGTTVLGVTSSPGVAVCATASGTGVASVENCATVVISPATTVVPAVLQIASITINGNLNAPVPVPPAAVAGQINVSVNLNPGTEKMDSVVVTVNGKNAGIQTFTSAQAAALRSADANGADQALQSTLVFSINTAAYNIATGAVTYRNGAAAIAVVGYGHQGTSAATNTSSQGVNLLFGNADGWVVTQTFGAGTNTAASAAGFNYSGGPSASVSVQAIPVLYTTGTAIASANSTFGTTICDASTSPPRTIALVAPVAGTFAWTGTWTRTMGAAAAVTNVNNYEFSTACTVANAAGGEGAAISSSLYTNNATGPVVFIAGSAIPTVRLDNRAPGAPSLVQNPRVRQNGWLNALVNLNTFKTAATQERVVVQGTADVGVGGDNAWVRIGAPGAGNIVDPVNALAAVNTVTIGSGSTAPTAANTSLCGVWTTRDAVGNESALPAAGTVCSAPAPATNTVLGSNNMLFGVDIAAPTIAFSGGLAANARISAVAVGAEFQVTVSDTGTVGNSGMLSGSSVVGTVVIRNSNTTANVCFVGTGATCAAASVNAAPAYPLVPTTVVAASVTPGHYLYTAVSQDAAGNQSAAVTKDVAYDLPANAPALTTALFNVPLTGSTAVFNANASDNFDLWKVTYNLTFAGGLTNPVLYPSAVLNTFPTAATFATFPLVNTNVPAGITLNGFMRQVENVTGNAPVAVGGQFKPTQLQGIVSDQANTPSVAANTAIPGASVTTGTSYLNAVTYPAPLLINSWSITPAATSVSTGATAAAVNPLSVTLKLVANGPTATFQPPFTSVQVYAVIGGFLEQVGSVSAFTTVDNGAAMGRTHTFSFVWTPGVNSPVSNTPWVLGVQNLYAIGVNANGDALVTPLNNLITLTNP